MELGRLGKQRSGCACVALSIFVAACGDGSSAGGLASAVGSAAALAQSSAPRPPPAPVASVSLKAKNTVVYKEATPVVGDAAAFLEEDGKRIVLMIGTKGGAAACPGAADKKRQSAYEEKDFLFIIPLQNEPKLAAGELMPRVHWLMKGIEGGIFVGNSVVITEVTGDRISGTIRAGSFADDAVLDGTFVAAICPPELSKAAPKPSGS